MLLLISIYNAVVYIQVYRLGGVVVPMIGKDRTDNRTKATMGMLSVDATWGMSEKNQHDLERSKDLRDSILVFTGPWERL
ncbi:UNVERIFIED_CONTAM: hypothetical protein PYX00_001548 [Menopon gallinae]|uniref:Uncharacterized protein n=1 Tax=Menopon gallinae TaxID=328185 RepID=A0AAW2IE72_9NEOP